MSLIVVPPSPVTLLEANTGAAVAVAFLNPLSAQLDLALFGAFGLGSLQADLIAQFNASIALSAQLSISISDPLASFIAALSALVQVQASIQLALTAGIPAIGLEINGQLTASAALAGTLAVRLGGLTALIEAALSIKIGAAVFAGELAASLSAGPVDILSFGFDVPMTAQTVGSEAATLFNGGLPGILGTDQVYGIMLVTKSASAKVAMQAIFKTA